MKIKQRSKKEPPYIVHKTAGLLLDYKIRRIVRVSPHVSSAHGTVAVPQVLLRPTMLMLKHTQRFDSENCIVGCERVTQLSPFVSNHQSTYVTTNMRRNSQPTPFSVVHCRTCSTYLIQRVGSHFRDQHAKALQACLSAPSRCQCCPR